MPDGLRPRPLSLQGFPQSGSDTDPADLCHCHLAGTACVAVEDCPPIVGSIKTSRQDSRWMQEERRISFTQMRCFPGYWTLLILPPSLRRSMNLYRLIFLLCI